MALHPAKSLINSSRHLSILITIDRSQENHYKRRIGYYKDFLKLHYSPSRYWHIARGSKAVEQELYKTTHGRQKPKIQVGRTSRREPSLDVVKSWFCHLVEIARSHLFLWALYTLELHREKEQLVAWWNRDRNWHSDDPTEEGGEYWRSK